MPKLDCKMPIEAFKSPGVSTFYRARIIATDRMSPLGFTWVSLVKFPDGESVCVLNPETGDGYYDDGRTPIFFRNKTRRVKGWIAIARMAGKWDVADSRIFESNEIAVADGQGKIGIEYIEIDATLPMDWDGD